MLKVGLIAVTLLILGGCATTPPPRAVRPGQPHVQLPSGFTEKGVSVEVSGLWKDGFGNILGIDGIATNVSDEDLQLCQVTFDVIDQSGVKVSSAIAVTNGLKAAQSWRFQATFTTPYAVNFSSIAAGSITTIPAKGMTIGYKFDPNRANDLSPGKSTIDDAIKLLGPPTSETNIGSNVLVQWQYIEGSKVALVGIIFNQSAVMIKIQNRTLIGF